MDAQTGRFRDVHAALAEEHGHIMTLVDRVRAHRGVAGLAPQLEELHELLVDHFAHEQFPGGLYECMGAFGSRWHDELRVLIREHCELLSLARSTLERARGAVPGDEPAVHAAVADLAERLHAHEAREHDLARRLLREE